MSYLAWFIVFFLCGIFYVLFRNSDVFRYYVKFIALYFNIAFSATLVIPYALIRPYHVNNTRPLCFMWGKILAKFHQVKVEPRNVDNMKYSGPCVVVCNHQSSLDTIPMLTVWPDRAAPLAKKELLYTGPFGLAALLCGSVFIDRSNPDKARETLKTATKTIHDNQVKLFVFPEGTRNHGIEMLPFKKGAFHLAIEAQIPIMPLVFSSYLHFMNNKQKMFEPGYVIASALPPIQTKGLTKDDVTKLTQDVQKMMTDEFTKISSEVPEKMKNYYNKPSQESWSSLKERLGQIKNKAQ